MSPHIQSSVVSICQSSTQFSAPGSKPGTLGSAVGQRPKEIDPTSNQLTVPLHRPLLQFRPAKNPMLGSLFIAP